MVGFDPESGRGPPVYVSLAAGSLSGVLTRALTQPLDVLKIRLQLHEHPIGGTDAKSKYRGLFHATAVILREEKLSAFWKGHIPAQLLSVVFTSVEFASFEMLTTTAWNCLPPKLSETLRPLTHFLCGGLAGCIATGAAQPFDTIRTRFIAQGYPKVYKSMCEAARMMCEREGFRTLYKGLVPTLVQIAPQTGFQFSFYTSFMRTWRKLYPRSSTEALSDPLGSLVCGCMAGLCAKSLVHPLDVVKKRMQVGGAFQRYGRVVVGGERPYNGGVVACILSIARNEGASGFFKGLSPSLLKALFSTGLYFSVYEQSVDLYKHLYT